MIDNNNGTVTFDSSCGRFRFTCVERFYKKNGESIIEESVYNLMTKHKLADYLHNPQGPAIFVKETGHEEYWFNGKKMDEKEAKKLIHDAKFYEKFDSLLES